jgi:hypothetical protein
LPETEVDPNSEFSPDELLYRRVCASELTGGELVPSSLNSISFSNVLTGAPSVLRSRFCVPSDVLHPDCAGGRNLADWLIYFIAVDDLPTPLIAGDGREFSFFPKHMPEPRCGAHSVVACCLAGDEARVYVQPSRKVLNDLRAKLATRLLPITQRFDIATRQPLGN